MKRISPLFPAFSIAFGAIYVVCMHFNIAAFVYYPVLGEWHAGMIEGADMAADIGPPMFYFGWLFYALVGAAAFSLVTAAIPQSVTGKVWPSLVWIAPVIALAVSGYLMRIWL